MPWVFLKNSQNLQEKTYAIVRDSGTGASSAFCENFKNSFFIEHLRWLLPYSEMLGYQIKKEEKY